MAIAPGSGLFDELDVFGAQRGICDIAGAVLDLPPVRVLVHELNRIGAAMEEGLLDARDSIFGLVGRELFIGFVNGGLARDLEVPVIEHFLADGSFRHLPIQHPIGLAMFG